MKILGIYYGHNASICLLEDGKVIDFVSEERFTGIKNQTGMPKKSLEYLLKRRNLTGESFDEVVVPVKTTAPIYASVENKHSLLVAFLNFIYNQIPFLKNTYGLVSFYDPRLRSVGRFFYYLFSRLFGSLTAFNERRILAKILGVPAEKIKSFDHHQAHAFSAYFASPYNQEKALVLTLDAEGDGICGSVSVFEKASYQRLSAIPADNSLGLMYAAVTKHLGMKVAEHEYKVMGLAPYAKDYSVDEAFKRVRDLFAIGGESGLEIKSKFDMRQMPRFLREEMSDVRFDILAGVFQRILEETVTAWVVKAVEKTGLRTICLAGGVFMNVKLNQKINELSQVEKLFVMPSCGDESTPMGASYLAYIEASTREGKKIEIPPIKDLYWGPSFSNEEIKQDLEELGVHGKHQVEFFDNIEQKIADLLFQNKIVARVKGRMEWGARALGNRSILANPSNIDLVMILNEQMKDRDFWMPFAPSILSERADDYLINPKKVEAPYMILSFDTTLLARSHLKAALHPYDFTCRPQIVSKDWNPVYYDLLKHFEALTGIGGVLNTSFNLHGYPIVLGPKEALYAFEHSGLEYLALENYLVTKQ